MAKKIIAFGASTSTNSINKQLAEHAIKQLTAIEANLLDLNDFELPLYSIDLETESGIPENAMKFRQMIRDSDGVMVSLAEHNGLYTSAFKNLWDWMSRIENPKVWEDQPVLLLGTSPSRREESNVMKVSQQLFPLFGAKIVSSYHLPSFHHFFKDGQIIEAAQQEKFAAAITEFEAHINR